MSEHTPGPWEAKDKLGAGLEIFAPIHLVETVEWPTPPDRPAMVFSLTGPAQQKLIACERWVQFEPKGWHEMQLANARLIAAAPQMLTALEYAHDVIKQDYKTVPGLIVRAIEAAKGTQ